MWGRKKAYLVYLKTDLYAGGVAPVVAHYVITSVPHYIPAGLVEEITFHGKEDEWPVMHFQGDCTVEEKGRMLILHWKSPEARNDSGRLLYPDGYSLSIPLHLITKHERIS